MFGGFLRNRSVSRRRFRFARGARAAAKIRSEVVARILEVATRGGGIPYMGAEFPDQQDLRQTPAAPLRGGHSGTGLHGTVAGMCGAGGRGRLESGRSGRGCRHKRKRAMRMKACTVIRALLGSPLAAGVAKASYMNVSQGPHDS